MQACPECGVTALPHRRTCSLRPVGVREVARTENSVTYTGPPLRLYLAEIGRKGGQTRSSRLTPEQRSEAARKAAKARWAKP